jgi:CheY-like chemotaxis protein
MFSDEVILVADDNRDDVCLLRCAFREAGIDTRIESVSDGGAAIDYLRGSGRFENRERYPAPDLMFLELRLPRVDGFEVLEWLRNEQTPRHMPVVVLGGPESNQSIHRALRLGAAGYFQKPLRFRDLVELVRNEFAYLFRAMPVAA